jgi:hypothetical protein
MAEWTDATREEIARRAAEIQESLRSFSESAAVFSSDHEPLIERYENKWVGVYEGKVAAAADSLDEVTHRLMDQGVPLGDTMIRRIDREEKTFIF